MSRCIKITSVQLVGCIATLTAKVIPWWSLMHTFLLVSHTSPNKTFFPKPPTTFLTCFSRGESRKYAGKKNPLNRVSNSQPQRHESYTLTTEPSWRGLQFNKIGTLSYLLQEGHHCLVMPQWFIHKQVINLNLFLWFQFCFLYPFPNKPLFSRVCSTSLLKILWEQEKLLVTSNFSFSHSIFYPFGLLSAIFIEFKIVVCKLFQSCCLGKGQHTIYNGSSYWHFKQHALQIEESKHTHFKKGSIGNFFLFSNKKN